MCTVAIQVYLSDKQGAQEMAAQITSPHETRTAHIQRVSGRGACAGACTHIPPLQHRQVTSESHVHSGNVSDKFVPLARHRAGMGEVALAPESLRLALRLRDLRLYTATPHPSF
jgi:hypothetical protein